MEFNVQLPRWNIPGFAGFTPQTATNSLSEQMLLVSDVFCVSVGMELCVYFL